MGIIGAPVVDSFTNRIHVGPDNWGQPATDFWINAREQDATLPTGWTNTSILIATAGASDFNTVGDSASQPTWGTNADLDQLMSVRTFGGYWDFQEQADLLGYMPTKLYCDILGVFTVHSANETATGFGLTNAVPLTITNHVAYIHSNSTNFAIRNGATTTDAGAALDTNFHLFRIVAETGGTFTWYIDGVSQGTLAIIGDLFPCAFGMSSSTTNRPHITKVHLWYDV